MKDVLRYEDAMSASRCIFGAFMKLKLLFNSLAFLTPHENKTYGVFFPRVCERGVPFTFPHCPF